MKLISRAAIAAILLTTACSSPTPATSPSVTLAPQNGTTPGMTGHAMPNMSDMPAASSPAAPSGSGAPAPQGGTAVSIQDFKFNPQSITVPVGSTVTWTNQDEEPHTVAAKDGSFHSPGLDTHGTYSFTFNTPGSYDYVCGIHPFMTGTVVVTK